VSPFDTPRVGNLRSGPRDTPTTARRSSSLFATLPILRRADPLTLEFRAPTMRYAVRVLNSLSAMSFMLR
jgi:D-amino peptidase